MRAHTEGALSMSAIARELGLSVSRVSRLIARAERSKDKALTRRDARARNSPMGGPCRTQ